MSPAGRTGRADPRRTSLLGLALFAICGLPAALHLKRHLLGQLGADPLQALIHASGWWALALLLATLAITPLRRASVWLARLAAVRYGRRLSDWNLLIRHRRQLGLWSFFYATLHVGLYVVLDAGSLPEVLRDAADRPFIVFGLGAFTLLVPLAATSTQAAMRRLKKHWARLHLLVYPAAALGLTHAWWQTKHGHDLPWGFVVTALVLLAARCVAWRAGDRVRATELPERGGGS
jgi:sulfoxide reductase heme-binding subunit YedZ